MKKTKLSDLSIRELELLQSDINSELESRKSRQAAIDEVLALAASKGINLSELSREFSATGTKRTLGPAPIKYRHPDDHGKVWSGRGREPGWFKEALASGMKAEDLMV